LFGGVVGHCSSTANVPPTTPAPANPTPLPLLIHPHYPTHHPPHRFFSRPRSLDVPLQGTDPLRGSHLSFYKMARNYLDGIPAGELRALCRTLPFPVQPQWRTRLATRGADAKDTTCMDMCFRVCVEWGFMGASLACLSNMPFMPLPHDFRRLTVWLKW
jgi:hypothetical protein